jgi:hypothetical protein
VLGEALHVLRSAHDSNWPIVVTERELLRAGVVRVEGAPGPSGVGVLHIALAAQQGVCVYVARFLQRAVEQQLVAMHAEMDLLTHVKAMHTLEGVLAAKASVVASLRGNCLPWRADYACNPSSVSKNWQRARVSGCAV